MTGRRTQGEHDDSIGSRMRVARGCPRFAMASLAGSLLASLGWVALAVAGTAAAQDAGAIGAGSEHICAVLVVGSPFDAIFGGRGGSFETPP